MTNKFKGLYRMLWCILLSCLTSISSISLAGELPRYALANSDEIKTWWHTNNVADREGVVPNDTVRISTEYKLAVYLADTQSQAQKHEIYPYMSIPRSGRDKWLYSTEDGADFANSALKNIDIGNSSDNLTMTWGSFLYSQDVWVEVTPINQTVNLENATVIIRPTDLGLSAEFTPENNSFRIKVPFSPNGYRFSVDISNQEVSYYNDVADGDNGVTGNLSTALASNGNATGKKIHTEPANALLIFANPMGIAANEADNPENDYQQSEIHYVTPSNNALDLNNVEESVVYFEPGIHYFAYNAHAQFQINNNVKWVYLAPGAYLKGALQFGGNHNEYKVTGYGILSGEKYVYRPNKSSDHYTHFAKSDEIPGEYDCHGNCLKLMEFKSTSQQQTLSIQGITVANPPYHTLYTYDDGSNLNRNTMQMHVNQYKQVGSWYWETDGLEIYSSGDLNYPSTLENSFFHANDDVLKLYQSHVDVNDVVIWKNENGPVIQFGWDSLNISDIDINNINVIHNRMYWGDQKENTCLINSANVVGSNQASPSNTVQDISIRNFRSEGMNLCAIRLHLLSNWENISIDGLYIESWNELNSTANDSYIKTTAGTSMGNERNQQNGLAITDYIVGNELILRTKNNWNASSLGKLDFDDNNTWELYGNQPPTAHAGEDIQLPPQGGTVILDGSMSTDPDGDTLTYLWTSTYPIQDQDKSIALINIPAQEILGTVAVTLYVTDTEGNTSEDSMAIIIDNYDSNFPSLQIKGNFATVGSPGSAWQSGIPLQLVENNIWETTINAASSSGSFKFDVIGDWSWNYGDNQPDNVADSGGSNILLPNGAGNYTIRLDDISLGYTITYDQENRAPVANAGGDIEVDITQNIVSLDGSASFDLDNNISSYFWQQISGESLSIQNASSQVAHITIPSTAVNQTFIFQLTVTDSEGLSSTDNVEVSIVEQNNTVSVTFTCNNGWTTNGISVFIVGNHSDIGKWAISAATQKLNGQNHPIWAGQIELPTNSSFEWKCVKAIDNHSGNSGYPYGHITAWQGGQNNSLTTGASDISVSASF